MPAPSSGPASRLGLPCRLFAARNKSVCYDRVTMTGGGMGSLSPWTSQSSVHGPGGYASGWHRDVSTGNCAQVHVRGGVSWGGGQHGRAGMGRVWRIAASEGGGALGDKKGEWMGGGGVRRSVRAAVWASRLCFYYRFPLFARNSNAPNGTGFSSLFVRLDPRSPSSVSG